MKKLLKALATLATVAALSSPAAAQISGELTLKTTQFQTFSAYAALDYSMVVAPNVNAKFGLEFSYFLTTPSKFNAFAQALIGLGGGLGAGVRADAGVINIGATNDLTYLLQAWLFYTTSLVNQDNFYIDLYAEARAGFNGSFLLSGQLKLDGAYALADHLAAYFGVEGDLGFTLAPAFAVNPAATGYLELDYLMLNDALKLFAGIDVGFYPLGFGDAYAGLRYQFDNQWAVKFVTIYNGAFVFQLSGLYNR